jgi:hypothetical protein
MEDKSMSDKNQDKNHDKKKDNRNIILVSTLIGAMLIYMLGTVVYVTNQVANCSSAKKLDNAC